MFEKSTDLFCKVHKNVLEHVHAKFLDSILKTLKTNQIFLMNKKFKKLGHNG